MSVIANYLYFSVFLFDFIVFCIVVLLEIFSHSLFYFGAGTPVERYTCITQTFIQRVIGNGGTVNSIKE